MPLHRQLQPRTLRNAISRTSPVLRFGLMFAVAGFATMPVYADQFAKPTQEELSMTSLPGFPGAAAVVLYREQVTTDDLHVVKHYDRIKVLTEEGKKYANIELGYVTAVHDDVSDQKSVDDIAGRTIHPDGTIVPFTGKPYLKVIEKDKGFKVQQKVFTLPDVTVGSIIEYRYATRIDDGFYESPSWMIQGDLYIKAAHYMWLPTAREMVDADGAAVRAISWFPLLPQGATIQQRDMPGGGPNGNNQKTFELTVKDIPPRQTEDYMPPIRSLSYRVLFNYTPYSSVADYWKASGKRWSKNADSFIGPNGNLTSATQTIIAGATTQEQKLRKIYAAVMELENTEYTREHDRDEDKAAGLGKINNASDVLTRKRGNPTQLTYLFLGMARAAGMKAYAMVIPDRSYDLFTAGWQNFEQFDNTVAIVNVDGKEQFFDPGQRYCEYGHLAWQDTLDQGLRQSESGAVFANTPGEAYGNNRTTRVANLTMNEQQELSGKIDVTFTGDQALHWRQQALKGDKESTDHSFNTMMETLVPKTVEVKIKEIKNLTDYNQPLMLTYEVHGTIGTSAGKRVILPVDLFVAGQSAKFPHEKRDLPVYFHYPETIQDAMRVNLPKTMTPEATPEPAKIGFNKVAIYNITFDKDAKGVTVRRDFIFNDVLISLANYGDLRKFYSQLESKDQESVVLKPAPVESAATTPAGN